jgi:5S rRNA maturation endonuclease (ribonuclease M5)
MKCVDMKEGGKSITVRGIVIPVDWDEKGTVTAAALSTHNEEEYSIDLDHKGEELLRYVQQEVEVSGVARKSNNAKVITISAFEVIKG